MTRSELVETFRELNESSERSKALAWIRNYLSTLEGGCGPQDVSAHWPQDHRWEDNRDNPMSPPVQLSQGIRSSRWDEPALLKGEEPEEGDDEA